ncbi:MAG: ATP-binding protein [Myxococcota bacterium]
MSRPTAIQAAYHHALVASQEGAREADLQRAYQLGRRAVSEGLGILDVLALHEEVIHTSLVGSDGAELRRRAWDLLAEVLAPFEMALRGFREANEALRSLNVTLEERVARRTAELRAAESRLRTLVEQLPAVTYVVTPELPGRVVYMSPQVERVLGFSVGEWTGTPERWTQQLHPDDRDRVLTTLEHALSARAPFTSEYRMFTRDQRVIWLRDEAVFLPDATSYRQGLLTDVTQRRELEEQTRHAQKMESVGRLAGGVAHDFNNLLSIIQVNAQLGLEDVGRDHPARASLEEITLTTTRAATLTRQLLLFARRQPVQPVALDVNHALHEMHRLLPRLLGEDVVLEMDLGPGLGTTHMDPGHFEQVVMNLAVNARDAMPQGGRITIRTRSDRQVAPGGEQAWVLLEVRDTGTGMTPDVMEHIFEPFFTTKEKGRGTGLGLATCYGIIQEAGGDIRVTSAPGQGTTLHVRLPCHDGPATSPSATNATSTLPRGTETVLLVEDDESLRAATARTLHRLGYTVLAAGDGESALRLLAPDPHRVQVMLCDVIMPGMDCSTLVQRVRTQHPHVRVLLMSGYTDRALTVHDLAQTGEPLLSKPFTVETLAHRLRNLLDR